MIRDFQKAARLGRNFSVVASWIALYAAHASLGKVRIRDAHARLDYFTKNVARWSKKTLDSMNVAIEVFGYKRHLMLERNFLIVANHLSYLDILVLSTIHPAVFVTSVELGEAAFLGPMAEMGGSIFVERRQRSRIEQDMANMTDVLRAGHNVVIFPEGTSGDGHSILPFKKGLLTAAVNAGVDVLPVVIKYTEIDGEKFSRANSDKVCWHGDMTFAPHFLEALQLKGVKVEVHFLDPIPVGPESTRHEIAQKSHDAIASVYFGEPMRPPEAHS